MRDMFTDNPHCEGKKILDNEIIPVRQCQGYYTRAVYIHIAVLRKALS